MTTVEKLQKFIDKIQASTVVDDSFRNLIGVELYDYIQEDRTLKNEFDRRVNYLQNLSQDKDFIYLQYKLYLAVKKILELTNLERIEELQKLWKNAFGFSFKNSREEIWMTLPELYKALLVKESYFVLGDNTSFYSDEGDIAGAPHISVVKKQYQFAEKLFGLMENHIFKNDAETMIAYKNLSDEYNKIWYKFFEKIHTNTIKLHTKEFVGFLDFCVSVHPREGHEFKYNFFGKDYYKDLQKIKKMAVGVIEDLIDCAYEDNSGLLGAMQKRLDKSREQDEIADKVAKKLQKDGTLGGETKNPIFKNGLLQFQGKELDFRNKHNQQELLATLFKEPAKKWSFDEIQGEWDAYSKAKLIKYPKDYWRKFYEAARAINIAVAVETGIKAFLAKNIKEIQVNPKYLLEDLTS